MSEESRPLHIFSKISPGEKGAIRTRQLQILDMVRVKIEEGEVASLALLMVAKDPEVSGGKAYTGSRFLVHATHLDILENVFKEMMAALVKEYGVTPDELRADREKRKTGA